MDDSITMTNQTPLTGITVDRVHCRLCDAFEHLEAYITRRDRPVNHLLIWCVQGVTTGRSGETYFEAGPGDLVVLPKGMSQRYGARAGEPWAWWWVHAEGPMADAAVALLRERGGAGGREGDMSRGDEGGSGGGPVVRVGLLPEVRACFAAMVRAWPGENPTDPWDPLVADSTLASLLALLLREADRPQGHAGGPSWNVLTLLDYIDAHLTQPLKAHDLAAVIHRSVPQFNRLFRERFGTSAMQFIADRRVAQAQTLLRETTLTVYAIAQAVGYDDAFYFSRLFKRRTGLSPRQYRDAER